MHSYQIIAALLHMVFLFTVSQAAPTQDADLAPRPCATKYPSIIRNLDIENPDLPGINSSQFRLFYDPYRPINTDALLEFNNIPPNAWGCQLEVFYPNGSWSFLRNGPPGGFQEIDVYRVTDPIVPNVTWNTAPKPAYLFGTPMVPVNRVPVEGDTRIVINTTKCESPLNFRISLPPNNSAGITAVYGYQDSGPNHNSGFRLTHMLYEDSGGPAELLVGSC